MNVGFRPLNTQLAIARDAGPGKTADATKPAPAAAPAPQAQQSKGGLAALSAAVANSDVGRKLTDALGAKSADEVVAAVTGGLVELAVERTVTKDLDKSLAADYAGTINAKLPDGMTKKALLALGVALGDHVASELVSASAGAVSGTTLKLLEDPGYKALYKTDKVAFGKKVAIEGGQNFLIAFATAFGTAKAETLVNSLSDWIKSKMSSK